MNTKNENVIKNDFKLALITITEIVTIILILLLLFLLTAGSIKYWEAWVYCLTLFVMTFSGFLYFFRKDKDFLRRRTLKRIENEKDQRLIQVVSSSIIIIGFIIPGFDYRFHLSNIPFFIILISDLFILLGCLIIFRVSKENSYASAIIEISNNQKVIDTGPYKIVRHPMYIGNIIFLLFTPVALGSYWAIIPFLIGIPLAFVLRIISEEKYLMSNLNGYKEYCQKTKYSLIPFIW